MKTKAFLCLLSFVILNDIAAQTFARLDQQSLPPDNKGFALILAEEYLSLLSLITI